ncbi:MAG: RNA pyrophosphohydrolase [Paracoccaceae bacterium]
MTPAEIARLPYRDCVGVVLARTDGRVFVGQRADRPAGAPPAWQMPQGGIDAGEDARAAALRELEEETGVTPALVTLEAMTEDWLQYDLPAELVPRLWGGRFRGQRQRWALMRFAGTDADVRLDGTDGEFSAWRWAAADELLDVVVPFKRHVYAAVLERFGHLL